jgi:23S rRNA (adenine2030-N6)-methyltransferase
MKSESALNAADAEVGAQGARTTLRADLWIDTPQPQGRLTGSSVLLINPPFGLREALQETLPALTSRFAAGNAGWRLQ